MNWGNRLKTKNKFGSHSADGFGSKLEAAVFSLLKTREALGEIRDIKRQQRVILQDGPRAVQISWRLDFSYVNGKTEELVFVEAKGFETVDYKLKLKMWRFRKPHSLEIWKGDFRKPFLAEFIKKESA